MVITMMTPCLSMIFMKLGVSPICILVKIFFISGKKSEKMVGKDDAILFVK